MDKVKKIHIKGVIVDNEDKWIYEWFEIEATSPDDVNQQLEEAGNGDLEVIINSVGGSVWAGSEIYTALKDHPGRVVVKIVALAASAASFIAMAGDEVLMSPTAQIMIHNASNVSIGDNKHHQKSAEFLKMIDKSITNAYRLKTGMSQEDLLALMDEETWMDAQEAKDKGFADEIMFDVDNQLKAMASVQSQLIPQTVIDKLRNDLKGKEKHSNASPNDLGSPNNKNTEEVNKTMNLEKLKNEHPDLYNQVLNAGSEQERNRIKALDELLMPGNEGIINKAKYETFATAEQTAMAILKAQNEKRQQMDNAFFNDANNSGVNEVDAGGEDVKSADEVANDLGSQMAEIINQTRGVKK